MYALTEENEMSENVTKTAMELEVEKQRLEVLERIEAHTSSKLSRGNLMSQLGLRRRPSESNQAKKARDKGLRNLLDYLNQEQKPA